MSIVVASLRADSPQAERASSAVVGAPASTYRAAFGELRYRYDRNLVRSSVRLGQEFTSHPGHIHGGLIATLFDEVMGHAAYRCSGRPMVTMVLRVRFVEPMAPDVDHDVAVETEAGNDGWVSVQGELTGPSLIAAASARFRPLAVT